MAPLTEFRPAPAPFQLPSAPPRDPVLPLLSSSLCLSLHRATPTSAPHCTALHCAPHLCRAWVPLADELVPKGKGVVLILQPPHCGNLQVEASRLLHARRQGRQAGRAQAAGGQGQAGGEAAGDDENSLIPAHAAQLQSSWANRARRAPTAACQAGCSCGTAPTRLPVSQQPSSHRLRCVRTSSALSSSPTDLRVVLLRMEASSRT